MFKVVRVKSDCWNDWMTEEAYKEATLQMSSGDHGAHTARHAELQAKSFKKLLRTGYVDFVKGRFWMRSSQRWEEL